MSHLPVLKSRSFPRGLLVCLVAGLIPLPGGAAETKPPAPPAAAPAVPPHVRIYLDRIAQFRKENRDLRTVVLLGDSITQGFDVAKYFPGKRVLNRGIVSDTIGLVEDSKDRRGVLKRLDVSVFDCYTSHVFLMIGINDLGDKRTPEQMIVGYRRIVDNILFLAPGVTVHIESLLPTRGKHAGLNANVVKFNGMLKSLAAEKGCPYMDLHSLFADSKGEMRAELTGDGLHINAAGYEIWKKAIDRAMDWAPPEPAKK